MWVLLIKEKIKRRLIQTQFIFSHCHELNMTLRVMNFNHNLHNELHA